MPKFDHSILTEEDAAVWKSILGVPPQVANYQVRDPDLVIAPHDQPYIYRWHIVRTDAASVYLHVQVADDYGRDLHDHPWENMSVVLSGGYNEHTCDLPGLGLGKHIRKLRKGDTVHRLATFAHRLELPPGVKYSMSLFSTGPRVREWGFYTKNGWVPFSKITVSKNGVSRHIGEKS